MNEQYKTVPFVLSSKDLDYLKDLFNWNYGAYKTNLNAKPNVKDPELVAALDKTINAFYQTMNQTINILSEGESNG